MPENTTENNEVEDDPLPMRRGRRRWIRGAVAALAVVFIVIAMAPYLFRIRAVRNFALNSAMKDFKGTVVVGSAPLGWFTPVRLYDIEVRPPEGPSVMFVPSVEGDVPLWRLLLNSSQLGDFKLDAPHAQVLVDESGANFQKLFPPPEPDKEAKPATIENLSAIRLAVSISLFNGDITWQGPRSPRGWDVDGIQLQVGLQRRAHAPNSVPELVVEAGPLLKRASISPEMVEDVLKYAAPALSGATMARGEFSIDLDQWRLPLDRPQDGEMGGRFKIHSIEVGPGPVLESILATIRLLMAGDEATRGEGSPGSMTFKLARDSVVQFEMRDGRVYHEGFELGIGNLRLRTHGSVGLDQTIDMVAEIELPGDALTDRPFLQALASHTIVLPIGGTFVEPRINTAKLGRSSLQAVLGALDALADDDSTEEQSLLKILMATGLLGKGGMVGGGGDETANADSATDGESVIGNGQILDLWQAWQQRRKIDSATSEEDEAGHSGRLLDRMLRRRRLRAPAIEGGEKPTNTEENSGDTPVDEAPTIEEPDDEKPDEDVGRKGLFQRRRKRSP